MIELSVLVGANVLASLNDFLAFAQNVWWMLGL